jgi:hypothetical protein
MRRRDFGRGSLHSLRDKTLQIGVNRLILVGEDIPARLGLPRRTLDLLVEEVRHWHPLRCIHQLLLRLGQVSREMLDTVLFEPDSSVRYLDVVEHGGRWEFAKQALSGRSRATVCGASACSRVATATIALQRETRTIPSGAIGQRSR